MVRTVLRLTTEPARQGLLGKVSQWSQLYLAISARLTDRSQNDSFHQICAVTLWQPKRNKVHVARFPACFQAHRRVLLEPRVWWLLIWAAAVWQKGAGLSALRFW